ncbi:MAG: hypothetical protein FJX19_01070, partial [Alphaproteobacteria bacterium]|nr:hypothetical protein [Alphaproteobacteria bacterium]
PRGSLPPAGLPPSATGWARRRPRTPPRISRPRGCGQSRPPRPCAARARLARPPPSWPARHGRAIMRGPSRRRAARAESLSAVRHPSASRGSSRTCRTR